MYFELGKEITTVPISLGKAQNFNVNLRYPTYRTALTAIYLGASYDWKSSYGEAAGVATSDKVVNVANLNLTLENTDVFLGGGFSQVQLGYTHGNLDLSKNASNFNDDQSDVGAHTNGDYDKYTLQFLRLQRGTERLTFQFLLNAQAAGKNLDGGEKISLGGPTGIRGYPSGEGSGDYGYRLAGDAKYVFATATKIGDIAGSIFYDYGKITQYEDPSAILMTTPNTFHLASWGLALDAYAAGKYGVKVGWAKAIGSNPVANSGKNSDGLTNMSRFWLMGAVNF
jgi:hemolysin activation/secretion protein